MIFCQDENIQNIQSTYSIEKSYRCDFYAVDNRIWTIKVKVSRYWRRYRTEKM